MKTNEAGRSQTATTLMTSRMAGSRWATRRLADVATIIMGQSPPSSTYNTASQGLPFFQGKIDFGVRHPTPRIWCTSPSRVAQHGDVLVSVRAPVGDVNIAAEMSCIGRGLAAVRPLDGVIGDFLFYKLLQFKPELDALGSGATFKAINRSTLETLSLEVPPADEQMAIAVVLNALQDSLENCHTVAKAMHRLRAATMTKVFREGVRGEPLKETTIGTIPASWAVVPLNEIARIERGKFSHRPRNDPRFYGGVTPFIQTGDVARSNGRIRTYNQTLNDRGLGVSRVFPKGTIVLTIAANIADTAILEFDSAFPDSLVGITPDAGLDARFLESYLRTQKPQMDRLAPKGTQKNINIQFLRPWPTPRPTLEEQQRIAETMEVLDERLRVANAFHAGLARLFETMLNSLLTGQVRLSRREAHDVS